MCVCVRAPGVDMKAESRAIMRSNAGIYGCLCFTVALRLGGFPPRLHGNNLERLTHRCNCARVRLIGAVNHHWSEGLSLDNKWPCQSQLIDG